MKNVSGSGREYLITEINLKNLGEFVLVRLVLTIFMFLVADVVHCCSYFIIFV